jgi:AcrR family transcriptional regulator
MKRRAKESSARRVPTQQRAQVTVEAMLDAAVKLLKRGGASSITTNRIAETAGVSVGSVYQYFPNKRAIFFALHERHISQVDGVIIGCLAKSADLTLEELVASLVDGMINLHQADPELSELLQAEVPHRAEGSRYFSVRLRVPFRKALALHTREMCRTTDLDLRVFFLSNMIDALGHAIVLRRPTVFSLARARAEAVRAINAYLRN